MGALIGAAERAGFWKLVSRVFVENAPSRRLLRSAGFREVGVYEKHARLDGAGDWDPTLAFVMAGALLVAVPAYRFIPKRGRPVLEEEFSLPKKKEIDAPLVLGSSLFGVGWGLVGFCPGPAIAALGTGLLPVFAFVAAMLAGMALHARIGGS